VLASQQRARRSGIVGVFAGVVLIVLGGYYLLRTTFGIDLPEIEGETILAIIAVTGGLVLLARAWTERSTGEAI
jgi:hypothetical protein